MLAIFTYFTISSMKIVNFFHLQNNIEFGWFAGDEKEILITDQELVHWLQKQFEEILNWQQTESLKSVWWSYYNCVGFVS